MVLAVTGDLTADGTTVDFAVNTYSRGQIWTRTNETSNGGEFYKDSC